MPRDKDQARIYMREYRRRQRLKKLGLTDDPIPNPHAACDASIEEKLAQIRALNKTLAANDRIIADLRAEYRELKTNALEKSIKNELAASRRTDKILAEPLELAPDWMKD